MKNCAFLTLKQRDDFLVMELELIEPSLYLRTDPDAPTRFARSIVERFKPDNQN